MKCASIVKQQQQQQREGRQKKKRDDQKKKFLIQTSDNTIQTNKPKKNTHPDNPINHKEKGKTTNTHPSKYTYTYTNH